MAQDRGFFIGVDMKEVSMFDEKRMTVKEVADSLGVADVTVNQNITKLFPGLARNGIKTYLNAEQVTAIKQAIQSSGRNDLMNVHKLADVSTDLEMELKAFEVMSWMKRKIDDQIKVIENQSEQLAIAAPKVESFNALMRSEQTMSITQAAKHFNLHPKTEVFPYLRDRGYLTSKDLPTQSAIDAGYLSLRESPCPDGSVRPQSVVIASQLETWRVRVVPQIKEWVKGEE